MSTDSTKEIILDYQSNYPVVKYLLGSIPGKGGALKKGVFHAGGEYQLICDADLAVPIEEVIMFLPPQLRDYDIIIGSREAEGSRRYGEPFQRRLMGRVFNFIVRALLLPGFHDTQCGFKCFRREAARELFSMSRINGWSFDVEIIYLARLKGYRIIEMPVNWYYGEKSKISPVLDTIGMLIELFEIRKNLKLGHYS